MMKLFKALLCLSVLSLTVSAAPQNILAGRVLSPHVGHLAQNIGLIPNIQSLRPFLRSGGFPAFSLLRSVPAVSAIRSVPSVQAVPAVSAVRTVPSVPAVPAVSAVRNVPTVQAVPAVSAVRAVPSVQAVPAVSAVPQVQAVPAVQIPSRQDPLTAVSDPTLLSLAPRQEELPAKYDFGYSVSDLESGDSKTRQESRDGDVVTGSYTVADPDGRIRTVTYTADSLHGFQAKVTYDGEEGPVAIPVNSQPEQIQPTQPVIVAKDRHDPLHVVEFHVIAVRDLTVICKRCRQSAIHRTTWGTEPLNGD